jgi:hypothetical protein
MASQFRGCAIVTSSEQRAALVGTDWLLILGLMALGLALRLLYYSGYGLCDDAIFRGNIAFALNGGLSHDAISYRFTWLGLSALSCKVFGLTELGMILPITAIATLGIGLIYLLGHALWARPGALIASLLLIVQPLDFAWSTMLTNDIVLSFFSALTIFFVIRALQHPTRGWRRCLWFLAGISLWVATQAKISAAALFPSIAGICLVHRRRLDRSFAVFLVVASILLGLTVVAYYRFAGDPLAPYHTELLLQGLTGPEAVSKQVSRETLWVYPSLLFLTDRLGDRVFSFYPHVLLALAVMSPLLGISTSSEAFWWFLFVFLGSEFNIQRVDGMWVSGFRNIRHVHPLVYPLILLLTGYLVTLRRRWPIRAHELVAALLVLGASHAVVTASKTHASFGDMRRVCRYLSTLPPKTINSDAELTSLPWCPFIDSDKRWSFQLLDGNRVSRKPKIDAIRSGYLVTGGGREPHYGCHDCIIRADELDPKWRLLAELPGPSVWGPWRPEPLRVWERLDAGDAAAGVRTSGADRTCPLPFCIR